MATWLGTRNMQTPMSFSSSSFSRFKAFRIFLYHF
ncbi:hypothetical protein COLO4_03682 [Corchorus olitorius]|uniref:Uncharacterized protein n=1 Tax=Corchorus olitorius TaxID=93759 RepID=A0A1R3KXI6_9ROSI|nr:hypothetical protein COLO4_03682 [Corchorus olitorius]